MAEAENNASVSSTQDSPTSSETKQSSPVIDIKPATPDVILFNDEQVPIELMTKLIFEDIGGHEIINYLRHDTVDGKNVAYNLVSNAYTISRIYGPSNMVASAGTIKEIFQNFGIRLDSHQVDTEVPNKSDVIYVDQEQYPGSIVIEVTGMKTNEQIEVQILNSGIYLDDII